MSRQYFLARTPLGITMQRLAPSWVWGRGSRAHPHLIGALDPAWGTTEVHHTPSASGFNIANICHALAFNQGGRTDRIEQFYISACSSATHRWETVLHGFELRTICIQSAYGPQ
jgi:hypothetical protein